MIYFKNTFYWITESTARTLTGIVVLALALGILGKMAHAATITSWDVVNTPQMYLERSLTATQTTNIQIAAPKRNGLTVQLPITTGAVLRITQGSRTEDIYYSTGSVNATSKIMTLYGVTRNVCWNVFRSIVSCGDGLAFSRGATVELSVDARLLNLKANIDRTNTFTASGSLKFTGSGSFGWPTFATTAERDRQMGTNPPYAKAACVTATGLCYVYIGGAWTSFGSGALTNASNGVSGKVDIATAAEAAAGTAADATSGGQNALTVSITARTSTASADAGKVGILDRRGFLSGTLLAQNVDTIVTSGAVTLNPRTLSGTYVLASNEKFVPLAPIGSIMMWPTNTAPTGWLLADGRCHTRTGTGAALFAVVGTTFSACDGITFGVPDMRGRFALGKDNMGGLSANRVTDTRADTIGSASGAEVLVSHDHNINNQSTVINRAGGGGNSYGFDSPTGNVSGASNVTLNDMNPYLTLNYIIRAR